MAEGNFAQALAAVLRHEGGYVDHPSDPGGATNMGITHKVLAEWRGKSMAQVTKQDVRNLTLKEAGDIYRARYWDVVKADQLPPGLDYAVFDYAVNSGPSRAVKHLQEVLEVAVDGRIGPVTLGAANSAPASETISLLCDRRMRFLRALKTWGTFGRGWTSRVNGVRALALDLAGNPYSPPIPDYAPPEPAEPASVPNPFMALVWAFLSIFKR